MTATKIKYSPSANIQRDLDAPLAYFPTPNAQQVFKQLLLDFKSGNRAFNIIGAYGTGKSSFLLALYQTLSGKKSFFSDSTKLTVDFGKVEFIELVGSYVSASQEFAERFKVKYNQNFKITDLLNAIEATCKSNHKKGKNTIIAVDEFGKFLEFAAKHNPEQELYFFQQLAELANDEKNNLLFITTLHQDFATYSFDLTKTQRNEWSKVKGRFKDITFNDPVEQLLFLAAERMQSLNNKKPDKDFQKLFEVIRDAKAFPLRDYFSEEIAHKLLPFDILSAAVLTLSLQKYGQNERSLFSFLESTDYLGINDFPQTESTYFNLASVYDYILHNYYSFINSKSNPHYQHWSLLKKSIERIDTIDKFSERQKNDAVKLIKSIGLLGIYATASAKLTNSFFSDYARLALGIRNAKDIIEVLEKNKVIRYVNHAFKYILFEGTDIDIDLAIDKAGNLIEKVTNVVHQLQQNFEFPFILAKKTFFQTGSPRFFQFQLSEKPIQLTPEDEIDGFVNLVFSDELKASDIKRASEQSSEAILFGYFKNTSDIQKILFEIQKVNKVIEMNPDDSVALRELRGILLHNRNLLNHAVKDSFYKPEVVEWYFKGRKSTITNSTQLNQKLSEICDVVYSHTPHFRNEMVNKTKLSGNISSARRTLVAALIENSDKENLGFEANLFPPEKTVYLALLKETGIHNNNEGFWQLSQPTDASFQPLWNVCIEFLNSAKSDRRNLQELANILSQKPYKLKEGFLNYWICVFLIAQNNEFALYDEEGNYVPELSSNVLDLLIRKPANFLVKTFNVEGLRLSLFKKYRALINKSSQTKISNQSFIETIKPFIVLYRGLNDYAKCTKRLAKETLALREAIANASDLERTFFEDFPQALGYSMADLKKNEAAAEEFIADLQVRMREIQGSYAQLLNRIEDSVKDVLGIKENFPAYQSALHERYGKLKTYLLLPEQKSFHSRLSSKLDDRDSYLETVAQACIGKPLEKITDEEENKIHARFSEYIRELDSLTEISKTDVNEANEEVLLLQVSSFVKGLNKTTLRIPQAKQKEVDILVGEMSGLLAEKDKTMKLSIIAKLLQKELANDK